MKYLEFRSEEMAFTDFRLREPVGVGPQPWKSLHDRQQGLARDQTRNVLRRVVWLERNWFGKGKCPWFVTTQAFAGPTCRTDNTGTARLFPLFCRTVAGQLQSAFAIYREFLGRGLEHPATEADAMCLSLWLLLGGGEARQSIPNNALLFGCSEGSLT